MLSLERSQLLGNQLSQYSEASMSIIFGGPDNGIVIFFYNNMNVLFEIF